MARRYSKRSILDFDELNPLNTNINKRQFTKKSKDSKSSVDIDLSDDNKPNDPYREYFGKMFIEPEQMETRITLAGQIEDVFFWTFAYWSLTVDIESAEDDIRQETKDKLRLVMSKHTKLDSYLERQIDKTVDEVIDTTLRHTYLLPDKEAESDYWLSRDRAVLIAENEANSFENYIEYRDAVTSGKTKKKWITELDDRVRLTHELAEGQTVDIDGLFLIGDSLMRFPMDTLYDPSPNEIINCRCAVVYE